MLAALEVRRPASRISERACQRGTLLLSCAQEADRPVDFDDTCPDKVGIWTTAHRDTLDQMLRNAAKPSIAAARCKRDAARGVAGAAAQRQFGCSAQAPIVRPKAATLTSTAQMSQEEQVRSSPCCTDVGATRLAAARGYQPECEY